VSTRTPCEESRRGPVSWFVRRAGLARCTTIAGAGGLAIAALAPGHFVIAISGLTLALLGMLAGHALGRLHSSSSAPVAVTLGSVVLVGIFAGLLLGSLRISSLLDGALPSRIGETVGAEVVVTGPVSANSGWQSATAVVQSIEAKRNGKSDVEAKAGIVEADAAPAGVAPSGVGEKVLLEVAPSNGGAATDDLIQGARLRVRGALCAPEGPSASGYDQAKQLLHQGIRVVLEVSSPANITYLGRRAGVSGFFDRLREAAKAHLSRGPDERVNEVLQGVVMGDTAGIDEGWMNAFRRSGTAHMLSVSGLHVASLAAIMIAIAGFARLSRRAGFVLAAAAALLMVPFVGSSPPIVRSAVMMVVVLGGRWVGRRRDQWQGLAFAALIVLALNPFALFDVGFQLSFSAFAGMLALLRPLEKAMHGLPDSVRANLAVSVAATLGTAPISMLVFGRTSLISPVANLLVVPTLASVTGLGMASVLFGFLWSGFSAALDTLASLPMMWTIVVSTVCARVPVLDATYVGMVVSAAVAAALTAPAGLALGGRVVDPPLGLRLPLFSRSLAWFRRHRPHDRRRAAALGFAVVAAAALLGAAAYPAAAAGLRSARLLAGGRGWPSRSEVRVLDVGQGTAVLVRTPDHHAALFDGGPAGCGLGAQLRALGVKRLDLVVVSHPHADHFAGLVEALDALEVGTFIDRTEVRAASGAGADSQGAGGPGAIPAGADASGARVGVTAAAQGEGYAAGGTEARQYLDMRARLAERGCRCLTVSSGATLSFAGIAITFFTPPKSLVLRQGSEPWGEGRSPPTGDELNGGSIVTLLEVDGARFLLPGDAEADTLAKYQLAPINVLVVGHHGSRGAVSADLLTALHPGVAAISVGKDNTFGHPDPGTVGLLRAAREMVVRTDEAGWVCLRVTDGVIAVTTERTRAP
jgi:competence protein ComEC